MKITIDSESGCCFGLVSAIGAAEAYLEQNDSLYCLGDILHNNEELERLKKKGLIYIDYETYKKHHNTTVLIRAHGEPPGTYKIALQNNITLIDASCPVVLRLQENIRKAYDYSLQYGGKVVIYGKKNHAEVIGLLGQTYNNAHVVSDLEDLDGIDYTNPVYLFAQTTQSEQNYREIIGIITRRMKESTGNQQAKPEIYNTVCKLVSNRAENIAGFARKHDKVLFVSDKKSSNGKYLFEICKRNNECSLFISSIDEISPGLFDNTESVGICGATSTPHWLMKKIADKIEEVMN